jgi:hypothetical protein
MLRKIGRLRELFEPLGSDYPANRKEGRRKLHMELFELKFPELGSTTSFDADRRKRLHFSWL